MAEIWRPVPGYEGIYIVSDLGRVRHVRVNARILSSKATDKDGYPVIALNKSGKRHTHVLHRIVCRAFHGEPTVLHNEVAHLDGDRSNARADNLKWVSKIENHFHKRAHGTHQAGDAHPGSKLSADDVAQIRRRLEAGERPSAIARDFGVSRHAVSDIRHNRRWRQKHKASPNPSNPQEQG